MPELAPLDDRADIAISAIEHFSYCPRQSGLIHVEQTFQENLFTIRGQLAHRRVDAGLDSVAAGVRSARGIALWSERLGLRGRADLVEFRAAGPYPVEYKVGSVGRHAELQLCAQALCLEEMLGETVPGGALYSYQSRSRREVHFSESLRVAAEGVIAGIRELLTSQALPEAPNDRRCNGCSLAEACLPWVVGVPDRLRGLQGSLYWPLGAPTDA